jgi:hypothetical protein
MDPRLSHLSSLHHSTRRLFLQKTGFGLGGAALASMFRQDALGAGTDPLAKLGLHHPPAPSA